MAPPNDNGSDEPTIGLGAGGDEPPLLPNEWDGLRLAEQIGLGGMGVVYRAWQIKTERWVAVKMLRSGTRATPEERARFEREAPLLASLNHPNIVRVINTGLWRGDVPYVVMELVEGRPLSEWLRDADPSHQERLELFLAACSAVAHAHQKPIIHRDLKPGNIVVDRAGPKVLDFGIARDLEVSGDTGTSEFLGTLEWAAPEQLVAPAEVGTRTDVHALGLLLFFLLTGRHPRADARRSLDAMYTAVKSAALPRPSSFARVGEDLDVIVAMATEKSPGRRYATVDALRDDVESYLQDRPIRARKPTFGYVGWKLLRRHPLRVALGSFFVIVAVAAVIGWIRAIAATERANSEASEASEVAEYVVGFFEMSSVGPDGRSVGDAWRLFDHAYRGVAMRQPIETEMNARLLLTMGRAWHAIGLIDRAAAMFGNAETACRADPDAAPERLAEALHWRARTLIETGSLGEAKGLEQEALEIRAAEFGADSLQALESHLQMARIAAAEGGGDTEHALDEVIKRVEERGDAGRELLATALEEKARWQLQHADAAGATMLLRRAVALRDERFDASEPAQATARLLLGTALVADGRAKEADPFLREALGMRRRILGMRSPACAEALTELARACLAQGRTVEASLHAGDALDIWREIHGAEHPRIDDAASLLARIRVAQDASTADDLSERAPGLGRRP